METRANHVLIGLFTLIVAFALVLFALWAAKYSSDKSFNEYDVVFKESVTGLSTGGIVQYNGISVGDVRKLWLDPKDPNRVIVRIRVGAQTPIKTDTKAKLAFIGLTGVAQIQLSGGTAKSQPLEPTGDQRVAVIYAEESAFNKLFSSAEDITATAAEMLLRLNRMLSEENVARITATLDHLETITGTVATQRRTSPTSSRMRVSPPSASIAPWPRPKARWARSIRRWSRCSATCRKCWPSSIAR